MTFRNHVVFPHLFRTVCSNPSGSAAVSARLVPLVLYLVPPRGRLWLVVNKCRGDVCVLFSPVDSASATAALNERAGL